MQMVREEPLHTIVTKEILCPPILKFGLLDAGGKHLGEHGAISRGFWQGMYA